MKGVREVQVINGIHYTLVEHEHAPEDFRDNLYKMYEESCSQVCSYKIRHSRLMMSYEFAELTLIAMREKELLGFANMMIHQGTMHIDVICTNHFLGSIMLGIIHDKVAPRFDCRLLSVLAVPRTFPFYTKNGFVRAVDGKVASAVPMEASVEKTLKVWKKTRLHPKESEDVGMLMTKRVTVKA